MLSEMLNFPSVSSVSHIDIKDGKVEVKREIDGGQETVVTQIPFVAIVQKGIAKEPRIPSMRGIMGARSKPLQVIEPFPSDLLTEFIGFDLPKAKAACKKIDPENAKELILLLHNEAKVI
jgi:electron transfer flavoprotein beta subunit